MLRIILVCGVLAGLLIAVPSFTLIGMNLNTEVMGWDIWAYVGYATMIVALSAIFIGVKQYRDNNLGGVIKFLPALGVGLAISAVGAAIYMLGWEVFMAITNNKFNAVYGNIQIAAAKASGKTGPELDQAIKDAHNFMTMYSNPLIRMPLTFLEPLPVGVIISLISSALLRNSRFMPAREKLA